MKAEKIYLITVYNSNGSSTYKTYDSDIFENFRRHREQTFMFKTTGGVNVSLPPAQVIVEQKELTGARE